jgi:hypothetical protein
MEPSAQTLVRHMLSSWRLFPFGRQLHVSILASGRPLRVDRLFSRDGEPKTLVAFAHHKWLAVANAPGTKEHMGLDARFLEYIDIRPSQAARTESPR